MGYYIAMENFYGQIPGEVLRLLGEWNLNPVVLVLLAGGLILYARGLLVMRAQRGSFPGGYGWRISAYVLALLVLFIALVSPLHAFGEALFSAHMAQHVLIIDIAAPLIVFSAPLAPLLLALPRPLRSAVGRAWSADVFYLVGFWRRVSHPANAWILFAVVLWGWHIPVFFQAALSSDGIHAVEHGSFLVAALLFWWAVWHVFYHRPARRRAGILYLATFALVDASLGFFLILLPQPLYSVYRAAAPAFGASPLADQQLAGQVMGWAGMVYLLFILILLKPAGDQKSP